MATNVLLSSSDVEKLALRGHKDYEVCNWHGKMISVLCMLDRSQFLKLIQNIEEMCTTSSGVFISEMLGFAIRLSIITFYAMVELPQDIDRIYIIVYGSDLYDIVSKNINQKQLCDIWSYFGFSFPNGGVVGI